MNEIEAYIDLQSGRRRGKAGKRRLQQVWRAIDDAAGSRDRGQTGGGPYAQAIDVSIIGGIVGRGRNRQAAGCRRQSESNRRLDVCRRTVQSESVGVL